MQQLLRAALLGFVEAAADPSRRPVTRANAGNSERRKIVIVHLQDTGELTGRIKAPACLLRELFGS